MRAHPIFDDDEVLISFFGASTKALKEKKEFTLTAELTKPSQLINVYIASVFSPSPFRCQTTYDYVGKCRRCHRFPDVGTKCPTGPVSNCGNSSIDIDCTCAILLGHYGDIHATKEMDLQGLEDIPDFWDIDLDDDDIPDSHTSDFTKCRGRFIVYTGHPLIRISLGVPSQVPRSQLPVNPPVQQVERDPRKRQDGKYE